MDFVKNSNVIDLMDEITELCKEIQKAGIPTLRKMILADILTDLESIDEEVYRKSWKEPLVIHIFSNGSEIWENRIEMRNGWSSNVLIAKVTWIKNDRHWDPILETENIDIAVLMKANLKGAG